MQEIVNLLLTFSCFFVSIASFNEKSTQHDCLSVAQIGF